MVLGMLRGQAWLVQVSGEALYTDDVPLPANALHAVLVKSTRPHAKITSVDPSAALQVGLCSTQHVTMADIVSDLENTMLQTCNDAQRSCCRP